MTDDLHLARLTPEFTALCGVIGYRAHHDQKPEGI